MKNVYAVTPYGDRYHNIADAAAVLFCCGGEIKKEQEDGSLIDIQNRDALTLMRPSNKPIHF